MFRRFHVAAVVVLALGSSAAAALPAAGETNRAVVTHKLIVAVKKTLAPAAQRKLAVLVLISQNGDGPAGLVVTASRPRTVFNANSLPYRVKAEIDSSCQGHCAASLRISGSANHKLVIVPSCQPRGSGFVCRRVKIVKVY